MHTLLDDAGFAVLSDASANTPSSWDRLNDYALDEAMSDTLSLRQILCAKPWLSIADKMDAIAALPWPEGKVRSALLLFVADEIRDSDQGHEPGRMRRAYRKGYSNRWTRSEHGAPYWGLAVVDHGRNGQARFREALAQHAYSRRQPVPLDSRFERATLNCLIHVIDWVRRHGVDVTLSKPLFDRQVESHDGEPLWCRPDFELPFSSAARAHRVVVETMGADDADYLERKLRMHDIMRRHGILLEHHVLDDGDQAERDKAFVRRTGARILDLAGIKRAES
ncbi:hypothetical protein WL93_20415 [Burkholderia diffusa]|nr:hypothetical protein WL93_20415 [Burkholderia diffusa]